MPSSWSRFSVAYCALCIVLGALTLFKLSGCGRSMAQGLRPDLAGTWDLVYGDVIDVEVMLGSETYRSRVSRDGGVLSWLDGGAQHALHIDCSRPELVCPNETLDSQLRLTNRLGDVDDDGERLVISARRRRGALSSCEGLSRASADRKSWRTRCQHLARRRAHRRSCHQRDFSCLSRRCGRPSGDERHHRKVVCRIQRRASLKISQSRLSSSCSRAPQARPFSDL